MHPQIIIKGLRKALTLALGYLKDMAVDVREADQRLVRVRPESITSLPDAAGSRRC